MIHPFHGASAIISPDASLAPTAVVAGDVARIVRIREDWAGRLHLGGEQAP